MIMTVSVFGGLRKVQQGRIALLWPIIARSVKFPFLLPRQHCAAAAHCPTLFVRFVTLSFFPVRMHPLPLLGHTIKENSLNFYLRLYTGLVTSNNSATSLQSCCQQGIESCYLCLIIPLLLTIATHCIFCTFAYICMGLLIIHYSTHYPWLT